MNQNHPTQTISLNGRTYYPRVNQTSRKSKPDLPKSLPIGRVSVDTSVSFGSLIRELSHEMSAMSPAFPLEYLDAIQNLSLVNPNVAQMIDNIIQLGNTGHQIVIESKNQSSEEEALEALNQFQINVFQKYGGIDGFVNLALAQICRGGALSVEWIIENRLEGIERLVFVPLKDIRFIYDTQAQTHQVYQKTRDLTLGENGYIKLNPLTYQYSAIQTLDNSPYAIPPILSALESVMIQREIVKNLKFMAKKMGLLGFVNFLIQAPKQIPGEKTDSYISRCESFLEEQTDRLQHNYRDGIAVGFKDSFSLEYHSITGGAEGAKELFEMNEQQVFSGLKSDPALHGRTYSTTETYAGVVYEKMLSILTNYQRTVKSVLEYGYKLHLRLLGFEFKDLWVEFEPSKSLSSERDENTYGLKLNNLKKLYDQGIINQEQFAQEAGYDAPAEVEPRNSYLDQDQDQDKDKIKEKDKDDKLSFRFDKKTSRYRLIPKSKITTTLVTKTGDETESKYQEFQKIIFEEYSSESCGCATHQLKTESEKTPAQKKVEEFEKEYFALIYPFIKESIDESLKSAYFSLKKIDFTLWDSELFASTLLTSVTQFYGEFIQSDKLDLLLDQNLSDVYRYFRLQDAEPFGGRFPIQPSFNLVDEKAIEFLKKSDRYYFGRHFTNPQTEKALKKWIVDDYLRSGRNLRDPGELKKFFQRFGDRVAKEDYKILRIVETTVNRARNWGNIFSVQQMEGSSIKITGPVDNVSCDWCEAMVRKTFSVEPVVNHIKNVLAEEPEKLSQLNPFLPGQMHPKIAEALTEDQLLARGISLPPYHPHCRHGYVVAAFG